MYQFFVEEEQIGREFVTITGSDVNHIKHVLRMKPGDKLRISDGERLCYNCRIEAFVLRGIRGGGYVCAGGYFE